jgi:hypothetical protein
MMATLMNAKKRETELTVTANVFAMGVNHKLGSTLVSSVKERDVPSVAVEFVVVFMVIICF